MNKNFSCDIIKDLLPGYMDGILSEAGTDVVKEHLKECEKCNKDYLTMKEEWNMGVEVKEQIVFDGFKKIHKNTRKLKIAVGMVTGLLMLFLISLFAKVFIIGEPLSTCTISVNELLYNEETNCLEINGTVNLASSWVSRVVWKQDEENENDVNILVYGAEALPFQPEKKEFKISVPNMKGKTAYLACPEYDRREIYNWKHDHYEKVAEMEEEIYNHFSGLDRNKDALSYINGIRYVNGIEGICYSVHSVIGENATFWRFNDQLVTDGDFKSKDFEIWISINKPYQILIYDYQQGKYIDDDSIINRD